MLGGLGALRLGRSALARLLHALRCAMHARALAYAARRCKEHRLAQQMASWQGTSSVETRSLGVEQRSHERARVERLQVVDAFADAHKLDGQRQLVDD